MSPRVLVVDDDPEIVDAVGEALQDDGYLVETATDGATALKRVLEAPPDLIVLDVRMPNLNGWEFCEIVRRQSHTRDVPVLFLTACSEVRDQITAMQVGGSDHLPKPFRLAALRDKVRSLTRESKTQGGS
jgi:DNA-binding response OmpR family regulator